MIRPSSSLSSFDSHALETFPATGCDSPALTQLLDTLDRLDPERLGQLYDAQSDLAEDLETQIIDSGLAEESQIAQSYARQFLLPVFEPDGEAELPIDPAVAERLPASFCRQHRLIPLNDDGHTLEIAVASPDAFGQFDSLQELAGRRPRALFAPLGVIRRGLRQLYGSAATDEPNTSDAPARDGESSCNGAPALSSQPQGSRSRSTNATDAAARYVHRLFEKAVEADAESIYLESSSDSQSSRVRFRLDGELAEVTPPPAQSTPAALAYLKRLAKCDETRCDRVQEGVIALRCHERRVALRLQTVPTSEGESVSLRVRNRDAAQRDLFELDLSQPQYGALTDALHHREGLVLVCGPGGSGITTTLYSCLRHFDAQTSQLATVEQVVESRLDGVAQVQALSQVELDAAGCLQAVLRQRPDIVMVDELADVELADTAVRAASTGRLVLSSLAVADAFGAITRLERQGIGRMQQAAALRFILVQRTLRKLCVDCSRPVRLSAADAQRFELPADKTLLVPGGCTACRQTGYRGRVAAFEAVVIDDAMRARIAAGEAEQALQDAPRIGGTLRENIRRRVLEGVTSPEEADRVGGLTAW
ncbi:GspE/PulE family protein [Roseimaritima sediminicola]|uniref:GspE/PulE family protein n=1 Tax=Roseimaritima sediminicola TaxID=2662066 RepID=UPI0013866F80|nr:ATPase, T2SS/T4P/T4SS family [Roseimaritima sediminicola]